MVQLLSLMRPMSGSQGAYFGLSVCCFFVSGCAFSTLPSFVVGTYEGAASCVVEIQAPDGASGQSDMDVSIVLTVEADDTFSINGVDIEVGAEVTRSLTNADLTFEVASVMVTENILTVTYAPRPTLPGITIEGTLIETYRSLSDRISVEAVTTLQLSDLTGETSLSVSCQGSLASTAP